MINQSKQFQILHAYASAEEALAHIVSHPPDIAIVDIKLPGKNGIDLIAMLKEQLPATLCMVCSYYDDNDYIFTALRNGAVGYILKDAEPYEIIESLEEINNGGAPMSRYIAKKVVSFFEQKPIQHDLPELSDRENEILNHVSTGLLIKEIADKFFSDASSQYADSETIYQQFLL